MENPLDKAMPTFTKPNRYTVTQLRSAVACPRVFYFDVTQARRTGKVLNTTRLWKSGEGREATACGSLFHQTLERFHSSAATDPVVAESLATATSIEVLSQQLQQRIYFEYLKIDSLAGKTGDQQQNFMSVLRHYVHELASFLWCGRLEHRAVPEILTEAFGETRRKVNVTFRVGQHGEPVDVAGVLDYLFYDGRIGHRRILDYKLMPPTHIADDLMQVCTYALMHHQQHHTQPAAAVLYLHPLRQMVEKSWAEVWNERHKVYNQLASMREWEQFDEQTQTGLKPPGEPTWCDVCRWNQECTQRLGPKDEGQRLTHWTAETASEAVSHEPLITANAVVGSVDGPAVSRPESGTTPPAGDLLFGQIPPVGTVVAYPARHLKTHTAVVGAAGSGKTWMAKVIVEEAIRQGIPVVAIDPQGDLVQFAHRTTKEIPPAWRSAYDQFDQRAETRVYTPGSSHAQRLSLSPLRLPSVADLAHLDKPERREEELTNLLAGCAGNLVDLADIGGEVTSQRTLVFKILRRLYDQGQTRLGLPDVIAGIGLPEDFGINNADQILKKTDREKLARKLYAFIEGPAANLFQGGQPLDFDQLVTPSSPDRTPLNIIYLNAMAGDQEKQFFVAMLAEEIYRWMLTRPSASEKPSLLFYLDEARDFMPAGMKSPPGKASLLRLFTQGRKYGVGCLLCTQSPRSVDYNAFGNCSTKIIGRLEAAQDLERVTEWFSREGATPRWISERKGANPGSFVARWPEMPPELEGQAFASRPLFSQHGGAWSPEQVENHLRIT